jgi:hypothetical protein
MWSLNIVVDFPKATLAEDADLASHYVTDRCRNSL